jgi:hypothetical protein
MVGIVKANFVKKKINNSNGFREIIKIETRFSILRQMERPSKHDEMSQTKLLKKMTVRYQSMSQQRYFKTH